MPPINYNNELGQARAHALTREKRIHKSVNNSVGCWLFTGSLNTDGYGQVGGKQSIPTHANMIYCRSSQRRIVTLDDLDALRKRHFSYTVLRILEQRVKMHKVMCPISAAILDVSTLIILLMRPPKPTTLERAVQVL